MITLLLHLLLLHLLLLLPFLCGGHRHLALENLALRQQLAVYKQTVTRPKLRRRDRVFWVWLSRVRPAWKQALVIVAPDTVLRWQRRRVRRHWTKLSFAKIPSGGHVVDLSALIRGKSQLGAPDVKPIEPQELGPVVQLPEVGGLHHRYARRAA